MNDITFSIRVPTDGGFLGRECNSPTCRRYFRIQATSIRPQMYCPYCGVMFSNNELHTPDQLEYLRRVATEKAKEVVYGEFDKMFSKLAQETRSNKFITFKHNPVNYRAQRIVPSYKEKPVDTELQCPDCYFVFQVFGIFGYCPGCKTENMKIYDANLAIIEKELTAADDLNRALRHAYDDLVSTFEQFSLKKAPKTSEDRPKSFQDLFAVRAFFKKQKGIDIFDQLDKNRLLCLRHVFQKRHAYQHASGKITDQYVRKIPEDAVLLGTQASLSVEEFRMAAMAAKDVLLRLH